LTGETIAPIYLDGPLEGKIHEISLDSMDQPNYSSYADGQIASYRFIKYIICGHLVFAAYCEEFDEDKLFGLLVSKEAKLAAVLAS
jgi:hypothetical protein